MLVKIIVPIVLSLFLFSSAKGDPVIVSLPITSVVFVSLTTNPVVTIGGRTIDFTPNLSQEFIAFMPVITQLGTNFRATMGIRARDGLASLIGLFPLSPDPNFANVIPAFPFGTTDLLLFDFVIQGYGTQFSLTVTDLDGTSHNADFATPVPEPGMIVFLCSGFAALVLARTGRGEDVVRQD